MKLRAVIPSKRPGPIEVGNDVDAARRALHQAATTAHASGDLQRASSLAELARLAALQQTHEWIERDTNRRMRRIAEQNEKPIPGGRG